MLPFLAVVALCRSLGSGAFNVSLSDVSEERLKATVEKLASFPNRNTSNSTLTEAAEWVAGEFRKIPGLQVEIWKYHVGASQRVPEAKDVVEVIATLPGKTDRRILVGGHMDSINMGDVHNLNLRAPGANDDGSGVALTLELARVMSKQSWDHTLNFVAFSGEEQGLYGSTALARRAKQEAWKLDAVLSNDMVGNSSNNFGQHDDRHVRLFSEESPNHNSRELARFIEWIARGKHLGTHPKLVMRRDRFGRGGDHSPFNQQGFTAVRFVDVNEEFSRQHTEKDLPQFMDFRYLMHNAQLNLLAMSTLASAGPSPTRVRIDRHQGQDTTITWVASPGTRYIVYWRDTANPVWEKALDVGEIAKTTIRLVNKDDHIFAVGATNGVPVVAG